MSYQVLARKWRPQTFAEVVGQQGVTQTLQNALTTGRLAQAFVFAGARGVGKTTTARILAKALNCVKGPTPQPCGVCDACREIAEGRDMDVLEIDAATHTQVDKVRDIIIENLGLRPVRDRYKVFIIDEVHMLSTSSFNALLKSVEEPPPHVVFIMATTELHKIPDTIRSRAQEFEFRTIGTRDIVAQLETIAAAEGLDVEPAALSLIARAAEGSLRDAESALDQVIAFAGDRITAQDVTTVLGLVGRDLLLDVMETVADEDAPRVFDLASRVVESGQDLRLLCRELTRVVRDMMVVRIDRGRIDQPEFRPDGDVDRLVALAGRFSQEDLLRAFDVIARGEFELRNASQPRYHLEMLLLKLVHLRKLTPLADLVAAVESGETGGRSASPLRAPAARAAAPSAPAPPRRVAPPAPVPAASSKVGPVAAAPPKATPAATTAAVAGPVPADPPGDAPPASLSGAALAEAFTQEVRRVKRVFHDTVIAQAAALEARDDAIVFTLMPRRKFERQQVEEARGWLEAIARQLAGRRMRIEVTEAAPAAGSAETSEKDLLKQRVLAEPVVQDLLDVFPGEIRDVESIDPGNP
ncbi:MAG: DNA polymerase III subunit gamma/tau [Vicinamibacteraceae bacterium]|nr:DNA polymerase III subunit gamma/tau [Vicinamibacteraceae bacterium]